MLFLEAVFVSNLSPWQWFSCCSCSLVTNLVVRVVKDIFGLIYVTIMIMIYICYIKTLYMHTTLYMLLVGKAGMIWKAYLWFGYFLFIYENTSQTLWMALNDTSSIALDRHLEILQHRETFKMCRNNGIFGWPAKLQHI